MEESDENKINNIYYSSSSGIQVGHETREVVRRREESPSSQMITEKGKKRIRSTFKLRSEIEQSTDLKHVMEERIQDSRVELTLREILGIAKKEFHDVVIDLIETKRLTEPERSTLLCPRAGVACSHPW